MKALLVHNYYSSAVPSGEQQVFELERSLLERNGHEVASFVRRSDDLLSQGLLGLVRGAAATPWNPWTYSEVRRRLSEFPADVVHVHNTFPSISPSIFSGVGRRAARVLTLHNFRLFCAAATALREGSACTKCLDRRNIAPAILHGCYRKSRLATLPLAASVALHRLVGTWQRDVDAFIALTEFQRNLLVAAGLPAARVLVKPNFQPGSPRARPWCERKDCAVFAGRLSEEKGVSHLVDAWLSWGGAAPELRIAGDGPQRAALEARVKQRGSARVTFLGHVPAARAEEEIATAKLVVLPSIWFEGFPLVLREAFALGTPAAVSDLGSLPEIVRDGETGVVFAPRNVESLLERVRSAWDFPGRLEAMSSRARQEYERKYTEAANYRALMAVYDSALRVSHERASR